MKPNKIILKIAGLLTLATISNVPAVAVDPQLTSWQTNGSRTYARLYETDAAKAAGTTSTTWSRGAGVQTSPVYAGVIQVSSSANWVYMRSTNLGYHVMGPWYAGNDRTTLFGNYPANQSVHYRIPRTPTIPTTKTKTTAGVIGYYVDGVSAYDYTDTFSYSTASATDGGPNNGVRGDGVWIRDAYFNEFASFDASLAHQSGATYHYHAGTPAVRHLLGDNVDFDATTKSYKEKTGTVPAHSPILGWLDDGLPIYGPYGYSSPMNPSSGVRRMISGYVKRDGTNGTVNLAVTGRTTLPAWAATSQGIDATLPANRHGPAITTVRYFIGHYLEDYEYLGDLGKTQGVDFDLNVYNVRFCVTPDFPNGTWAYFTTIEADGTPKFPYIVGRWFYGSRTGGRVTTLSETVTEYVRASQASPISVSAANISGTVSITWTSVEGATYKIETSPDATTWTALSGASAVTSSGGGTTAFSTSTVATNYRVTLTALATYDTRGADGLTGVGNVATATIGSSGTARLIAVATRATIGGTAGTPIAGFALGGTGTKQMLARAVGPGLTALGVTGALADPAISLMTGSTVLTSNDNWLAVDATTIASTGAFALSAGSKDAALVRTLGAGGYTTPVTAIDGGSGVALLEIYDAATSSTLNVTAASTRAFVGTGNSVLIPAFVIGGTGSLKVLIRAVGPTLSSFSVPGVLADPTITLYSGSTVLATNDNWLATDATTMSAVGAFTLPAGSRDAAIVATLPAGAYTAVVSGVGNTTGTALVEIYVVP